MKKEQKGNLLWVDDKIELLGPYVIALEEAGFKVAIASTTYEALELSKKGKYDIYLVDIRMGPPDGIEFIRTIRPRHPEAKLAVLSSYLYLDRYRDQLKALDFDVQLIDKDFPYSDEDDYRKQFVDVIDKLAKYGVTYTIKKQEEIIHTYPEVDPFEIPLAEFNKKPMLEKDYLTKLARELANKTIEAAFAEGKVWVLLCGSKDVIRAYASSASELPTDDEIMEFARAQQRAPYHFFKPVDVEDWSSCGISSQLENYPTVTLEFINGPINIHFDTGAPRSFLSYEKLLDLDAIHPTTYWGDSGRIGKNYYSSYKANPLNIEVNLRSQIDGQTKFIRLKGEIVRGWDESPYARKCDETCEPPIVKPQDKEDWLCPERNGLIGRNILVDNKIVLILDGAKRKTGFIKEKKEGEEEEDA